MTATIKWIILFNWLTIVYAGNGPFSNKINKVKELILRENELNYRLPNSTHPETYDLSLWTRIDAEDFNFQGSVKIAIIVDEPTREIVLHYRELVIVNVTLSRLRGTDQVNVPILPYEYENVREFLKITTNETDLNAGDRLILEINYVGVLSDRWHGFFRSSYINGDGRKMWLAGTQLEPTDARHLMPCYDEPAHKSKFTIRITHGKNYTAISNMPETRLEHADDTATTSFLETPLMSSYLIALVVSNFANKSSVNNMTDFRHRVFAEPMKIDTADFGLDVGQKVLSALEDYLQVNYSLPKMDQVAMPAFGGAMENWGLVLYDRGFLWNESVDFFRQQKYVVNVIAHELSHQFFGNLVSPKWWTYIWLNEGFAKLYEHIIADLVFPNWKMREFFATDVIQNVLYNDAATWTRPMSFYAQTPDKIFSLFDSVSYDKAASVLYMFLHACSEKSFKKGITSYLKENSFKAVEENQLFYALNKSVTEDGTLPANLNMYDVFSSWSNQRGHPLLTVTRNYTSNGVTIAQHRDFGADSTDNDTATWWVPYNYATSTNPNFNQTTADGWLNQGQKTKTVRIELSNDDWLIFNKQQTSLYRVLYDETNYKLIIDQLNSDNYTMIHVLSRSQLLSDLYEFVNLDRVPINVFLDFISYLSRETEYAVWLPAYRALLKLNKVMPAVEHFRKFQAFEAHITKKLFTTVGIEDIAGESIARKFARFVAVSAACEYGLPECLNATYTTLIHALRNNVKLPPNMEYLIYSNGIRSATEEDLEIIWKSLIQSEDENEQATLARSLSYIGNSTLLMKYLNKTVDDFANDTSSYKWRSSFFLQTLNNGQESLSVCLQFLMTHKPDYFDQFGQFGFYISLISREVVAEKVQKEFDQLLTTLQSRGDITENTVESARKQIADNLVWVNKRRGVIEKWLEELDTDFDRSNGHTKFISLYLLIIPLILLFTNA